MSQTPDTYDVFQQRLGSNGARRTPGRFSGNVAGPTPPPGALHVPDARASRGVSLLASSSQ